MDSQWTAVFAGALLASMALLGSRVERLPLTPALIYLVIGWLIGPAVLDWFQLDLLAHIGALKDICELVVLLSLFAVGLKLTVPSPQRAARAGLRLATATMVLTIALLSAAVHTLAGFEWPQALLLAAILAPTDPVLASDVQTRHPDDRDMVRYALSSEGGLNDGTAFPFVVLGIALLAQPFTLELATGWLFRDVVWAVGGGVAVGYATGFAFARTVQRWLPRGRDLERAGGFLLLGVMGVTYGLANLLGWNAFLAVFFAAIAIRRVDRSTPQAQDVGPSLMGFNEQMERIAELCVVVAVGIALSGGTWSLEGLGVAALLLVLVRPVSVWLTLPGGLRKSLPWRLFAWFGIRGVGSLYYLFFALDSAALGNADVRFTQCVVSVIAVSVVVHGVSGAPFMLWYDSRRVSASRP